MNKATVNDLAAAMYDAAVAKTMDGDSSSVDGYAPYDLLSLQAKIPFTAAAEKFLRQDFDLTAAQITDKD